MIRKWCCLLLFVLIAIPTALGQSFSNQQYCSPPDVSRPTLNIKDACLTFATCVNYNYADTSCYYDAFLTILNLCNAENRLNCVELSAMYMVQLNAVVSAGETDVDTTYRLAWAFDAGDVDASHNFLDQYQYLNFAIELARGILLSEQGDTDGAIVALTDSLNLFSQNAIVYYLRGKLYEQSGQTELATYDYYWYSVFATPELLQYLPVPNKLVDASEHVEDWFAYPVLQRADGPGGIYVNDKTMSPPKELELIFLDSSRRGIVIANLVNVSPDIDNDVTVFLESGEVPNQFEYFDGVGNINYPFNYEVSSSTYLLYSHEAYFELVVESQGFESRGATIYVVTPSDIPDPRLSVPRPCDDLPLSWIQLGDTLESVGGSIYRSITLFSEPESGFSLFSSKQEFEDWWGRI